MGLCPTTINNRTKPGYNKIRCQKNQPTETQRIYTTGQRLAIIRLGAGEKPAKLQGNIKYFYR